MPLNPAVVVMAALINACERTGRDLRDVRAVVVGIGAAGTAISRAMVEAGIADVVAVDRHGPIDEVRCEMHHHAVLASVTNPRGVTTTAEALRGADVFVGVARRGSVDPALLKTMAERPIVFALSNPEPEILADEVPHGAVFATGRSDFPNQINNSLCFPGFFRGLLDAKATRVTASMKQAAAHAIASCVSPAERELGIVIPSMFHPDVHRRVAEAVATA